MCGIVGYVGPKEAAGVLIGGLRLLEYRGYDSAGIAILDDKGALNVERATGKLKALETKLQGRTLQGHAGVGHTRWATHGRPSDENAHPHEADGVVVVHNGIIENYRELKEALIKKGRKFRSETDTEVLAHLVADHIARGKPFVDAVRAALQEVTGAYAVVFMAKADPSHLVAARVASPLILGLGDGETMVASDIPAILPHTRKILALDEGEFAVLSRDAIVLTTLDGKPIERKPRTVDWTPAMAERGGYKHFMLKEIHEQPQAVADTLRGRISADETSVLLDEPEILNEAIERIVVIAMGTSNHAAQMLRDYMERVARVPCSVELASEFRYRDPLVGPGTLAVAISQSGETADTLAAAKEAKRKGARVLAITNVMESSLARIADSRLYTRAGVEIGVASTKAYVTQLVAGYLLALAVAEKKATLGATERKHHLQQLLHLPMQISTVLKSADAVIVPMAKAWQQAPSALFLGRGMQVATAYEGALKLKELSYIHAEGYAAGEMKHGPIALIDPDFMVLVVGTKDATYEKLVSNVQEVRAREGRVFCIVNQGDTALRELSEQVFELPPSTPETAPILAVLPLQLLAYHVACLRGYDVDQPRNLAKSVTVE
ncbi:MAG: glutamine--fructose-6-phosphate transaminase (isomerizing) [Deltaproteobacteria bacterium]|nr:glutamine--fructose-6-phosphate transaminase (isomerizing) [Deltaproteobacteria bacterium]